MHTPLVSIIVPIYKVEPYLRRCLDSIVNQTYTNLEIILVDDGSPDGCPQICDEYAAKDKRIVVIHKENGGLSDARNAGLDICKGEYVSFVDSDDWVDKNYIKQMFNVAINNHANIVISDFIKTKSHLIPSYTKQDCLIEILDSAAALRRIWSKDAIAFVTAWGKLIEKRLFEKIRFPVGKVNEDEYTSYKLYFYASKVARISSHLYYYYQRTDSIMGQINPCPVGVLKARVERVFFFKGKNMPEFIKCELHLLCWDLLYAYSHNYQRFVSSGYTTRKEIFSDFLICQAEQRKISNSSFEKISLLLFSKIPFLYVLYQIITPTKKYL